MQTCLRLLGLLLLMCLHGFAAQALPLGDAYFETVGDAEAIPDNNITALVQDQQGFIWIGTPSGLIRYDGYRFRRHVRQQDNPRSLGGVFIRSLLVASDGRLWVGTDADGVSIYDPATADFSQLKHDPADPDSLAQNQVRALAEDRDGRIWIGTRAGLDYWTAAHGLKHVRERFGATTMATDDRILALICDRRGELWIGSWNGLSRRRTDGSFERIRASPEPAPSLTGQMVLSLFELEDGRIAFGTSQLGSFILGADGHELLRIPVDRQEVTAALDNMVLAMLQPKAGELWLGGFGGIAVVNPHDGRLLRQLRPDPAVASSLAHSQVRTFLKDRSGQVWLGGYSGGLQRHDPANDGIRVLHHIPGRADTLSSPSVGSVLQLANGLVWVGTRQNGVDILDPARGVIGGHRVQPGQPGTLSNGTIISLAETTDGAIWVGSVAGLDRFDPVRQQFEPIAAAAGTTVRRLLAGRDGELWIGSNAGLSRWLPADQVLENFPVAGGQQLGADVNALALEADGRLWVGSAAGLFLLMPGARELQPVRARPGTSAQLSHISVVGLLLDRRQRLWVDTTEGLNLLTRWDGQHAQFDAISARLGRAGRPFGANLLEDPHGRIWTQYLVFDPAADSIYELGPADGFDMGTPWFRSYAQTRDGLLMFGGSKGLLIIDPPRFQPWRYAPELVISELKLDGQVLAPVQYHKALQVPAGARGFAVEFAALDFSAPRRNAYAWLLEGFDQDWIQADASQRIASYNNLWPGNYTLRVRGSNRNGQWAPRELVLPIVVLPRYWQTGWFIVLLLLALAGAVLAGVRLHTRRLRRHERELEAMVAQRTGELSLAKEAAETALVRLKGAQHQLVIAEKMASLGQLVAGVAHEINTPLGIALTASSMHSDQLGKLQRQVEQQQLRASDLKSYLQTAQEASGLVDTHLARAAQLVRNFKQVSVDRSTDERRHFQLGEYLNELVESLRLSWRHRPIELQLQCETGIALDSYPGTLGLVISTFCNNALLHAFDEHQAGTLQLLARSLPENQVELRFSDNGRGINQADLNRVFEPFFTTRRAHGCIGLGLHIVYNQVSARLGGEVSVSSSPGSGTTFIVRFPKVAPD